MNTKILLILLILPFLKIRGQTIDPNLISFSGNSISNGAYTLEYALGELLIETLNGTSYSCTQGLLQPTYHLPSGIESLEEGDVKVYPNPTSGRVVIYSPSHKTLKSLVFNVVGKIIREYDSNTISLEEFPKGIYILQIFNSKNHLVKIQSIVKI